MHETLTITHAHILSNNVFTVLNCQKSCQILHNVSSPPVPLVLLGKFYFVLFQVEYTLRQCNAQCFIKQQTLQIILGVQSYINKIYTRYIKLCQIKVFMIHENKIFRFIFTAINGLKLSCAIVFLRGWSS